MSEEHAHGICSESKMNTFWALLFHRQRTNRNDRSAICTTCGVKIMYPLLTYFVEFSIYPLGVVAVLFDNRYFHDISNPYLMTTIILVEVALVYFFYIALRTISFLYGQWKEYDEEIVSNRKCVQHRWEVALDFTLLLLYYIIK